MLRAVRFLCSLALLCAPLAVSGAVANGAANGSDTGLELVVVEAEGCIYCQQFRRELLPAYEASGEAAKMPVHFVDINALEAGPIELTSEITMVPTFLVVRSGREIGRIPGYVAPDTFFQSLAYLVGSPR
jgi:thioredoxin-related protein